MNEHSSTCESCWNTGGEQFAKLYHMEIKGVIGADMDIVRQRRICSECKTTNDPVKRLAHVLPFLFPERLCPGGCGKMVMGCCDECIPKLDEIEEDRKEAEFKQKQIALKQDRLDRPERMLSAAGVPLRYQSYTFREMNERVPSGIASKACRGIARNKRNMLICSNTREKDEDGTGVGKTHLMIGTFEYFLLLNLGVNPSSCLFIDAQAWCMGIMYKMPSERMSVINLVSSRKLLMIDDVGWENDAGIELISTVLKKRFNVGDRLITYMTTNLGMTGGVNQFDARYGRAIWSRVNSNTDLVSVSGRDLRSNSNRRLAGIQTT